MLIRPAQPRDAAAIWAILEPIIRAGETYALPRNMTRDAALAYWMGANRETFDSMQPRPLAGGESPSEPTSPRLAPDPRAKPGAADGYRETFVAEEDGRILGTYYLKPNQRGGGAHVANCGYATAVEASGRGIGRAMCEHSLTLARSKGYRAMQFNFVVSTNDRAVKLWQRLGFQIVGTLPAAFAHPTQGDVDALVMHRQLDDVARPD